MTKRDLEKTARNKIDKQLTQDLKAMESEVLSDTGMTLKSFHSTIGGKNAYYIDLKNAVINSPEEYLSIWLNGLKEKAEDISSEKMHRNFYDFLSSHDSVKKYLKIFLHRTYWREYDNLSKNRPLIEEAELWIGQNNADYGLLVSPRFRNNEWENDKSEIRHFQPRYWSIGHVLATGFVIPNQNRTHPFESVDAYLNFFENVLVRHSASIYQQGIAKRYCEFVKNSENPENILLLIPELRFQKGKAHKYRLDFCVIDVQSNNKIGFELSPSSSHTKVTGIKKENKTQEQINAEFSKIFEKEMQKHKDYFREQGIFTLIYTDSDLQNLDAIFLEIQKYLLPKNVGAQLQLHLLSEFFD